jgi:hypothetical protein
VHWFEDDIEIWRADVLYNEGPGCKEVYKYTCNIGPLYNSFAVIGNLTTGKFLYQERIEKKFFFKRLQIIQSTFQALN